jgi:hypothetical protein
MDRYAPGCGERPIFSKWLVLMMYSFPTGVFSYGWHWVAKNHRATLFSKPVEFLIRLLLRNDVSSQASAD